MKINAYEYRSALKDKEAPSFVIFGITADIIMSEEILKNMTEIAEFIENIFKIGAPLSEMRSEIVGEVLEKISNADQKTRNMYRAKLLNFVEEKFYSKEKNNKKIELLTKEFQKRVLELTYLAGEQLYERYNFQKTALAKQFPFMRSNNLWKGLGAKDGNEEVAEAINSGSLSIGFVGGANAMYALFDAEHGTSEIAYKVLYDTIEKMGTVADEFRDKYHLNYSILATPAESLAGRFLRIDKNDFGVIKNVTDRDYYVNSFHIDVKKEISLFDKIRKEAPFHKLTKGGHITYVELDGEARKNMGVMLKIVKVMKDTGIGYGSINHPVDRCRDCGTEAIIYDECPICKSHNISRIRRITGYLTGDLDSWNSAKQAEEHDRVKHGVR